MKRSPLNRKTRLNPINRERRARRNAEAFGPQAKLCRSLPCCVCASSPPSDPAHLRSRGAGGRDRGNVVPLCREHHSRQHAIGWRRFMEEWGVNIDQVAQDLEARAYGDQ